MRKFFQKYFTSSPEPLRLPTAAERRELELRLDRLALKKAVLFFEMKKQGILK